MQLARELEARRLAAAGNVVILEGKRTGEVNRDRRRGNRRGRLDWTTMQALKAHVHNGRLVLDEPTDLPEGTEVELLALDDLDPEERARLLQAIDEGVDDVERGDHVDGFEFIAQLRASRESAGR